MPRVTWSAVTTRSGTGMPLDASRTRANFSVALVTTVQRSRGSAPEQIENAGQHGEPLAVRDLNVFEDLQLGLAIEIGAQLGQRSRWPGSRARS